MKDDSHRRTMHVCLILPVPLLPLKGPSFICFRHAIALNNLGFKVTILSTKIKDYTETSKYPDLTLHGIKVFDWLPSKIGPKFFRHLSGLILSWPFILKVIIKERPDILHVYNPPDIVPMIVSLINRFFKIPYIFQMLDPGPESILSLRGLRSAEKLVLLALSKFMESIIMHHASGLITVNEVLKRRIIETRKYISSKPFIAQYNVSSLTFDTNNFKGLNNQNYILYIGTLSTDILGLETLIRLFGSIWQKHRTKLFIVGDGPLRKRLIRQVKSLSAGEYIKLSGYVKPKKIPEYLKNAKLCILPYLDTILTRVSTPTKLFEYISMGKAVVYPDFLGFIEILGLENPGIYRSAVSGDMMRVIENLLRYNELRVKTESINKQLSLNFDFNKEIEKIMNLYEEVYLGGDRKN